MGDKILAVVNGNEITENDLEKTILSFPKERQGYLKTDQGKKQLLDEMLSFEVIYNYAKENNMDSEKEYIENLEKIKKDMLIQYAVAKFFTRVTISDDDVKSFYEDNKNLFKLGESVEARHILVDTLDQAKSIISEINSGVSFEEAASKYSKCPSKSAGGNLGKFEKGRMVPEFEQSAFNLEIGVVSEPVKTQFGYHIIRVDKKYPESIRQFEDVKNDIKSNLLQNKQREEYLNFTDFLKDKYSVEIK